MRNTRRARVLKLVEDGRADFLRELGGDVEAEIVDRPAGAILAAVKNKMRHVGPVQFHFKMMCKARKY